MSDLLAPVQVEDARAPVSQAAPMFDLLAPVQVEDARAIVAQVDANKDGHIDFQEFITMMRAQDA